MRGRVAKLRVRVVRVEVRVNRHGLFKKQNANPIPPLGLGVV
jgi:hypothetical protein